MTRRLTLLVTCEHGGNRIPARYWPLFRKHRDALESHRGYDPGALTLARELAKAYGAELVFSTTSRLLVELNRSPHHRQVFSEISKTLPPEERERVIGRYYEPYREWVQAQVAGAIERGERVLHVSSHSFTPSLNGEVRRADVGLLYDPKRGAERALSAGWLTALRAAAPRLKVRRNYPYRGDADGLTTHLRRLHKDADYAGIEIEVNQKFALGDAEAFRGVRKVLIQTLGETLRSA